MYAKEKADTEKKVETVELEASQLPFSSVFSYGLGESLYMEDCANRIFYVDDEVDASILHTITMQIYKINSEDAALPAEKRAPIILVINSGGGSVLDGLGVMDAINASVTPIIGFCVGYAYSMAFNIYTQCDFRIATKNASFLYHDGYEMTANVTSKVRDGARFMDKVDERINAMIADKTKISSEWLADNARADNYWFAASGKEKGFVDAILGEDVTIADIFSSCCEEECCDI